MQKQQKNTQSKAEQYMLEKQTKKKKINNLCHL